MPTQQANTPTPARSQGSTSCLHRSHPLGIGLSLLFLVLMFAASVGCGESNQADGGEVPADPDTSAAETEAAGLPISEDENAGEPTSAIPEVNADTLKALRRQAASQGKVLVVDCWATWCPSCVAMFPHLHEAMKARGDDVRLVSLCFDEGEAALKKAGEFLTKHDAWDNAYVATPGSDAKDQIAEALGDTWDGGALPAIFVYRPDGTMAYEMLETRGGVKDWVDQITSAVDQSLQDAEGSPGQ